MSKIFADGDADFRAGVAMTVAALFDRHGDQAIQIAAQELEMTKATDPAARDRAAAVLSMVQFLAAAR